MGQVDQRGREYLSRIFSLVEARMAEVTSKLSSRPISHPSRRLSECGVSGVVCLAWRPRPSQQI